MSITPFIAAVNQISAEKNIPVEVVLETVEAALAAAYRKDYGKPGQIIRVKLDPKTSQMQIWQVFKVVKTKTEVKDHETEIALTDAKKIDKKAKVDGEIVEELSYHDEFGRIAAQTAKQVIIQRIREAERGVLYNEFKEKEKQVVTATVQQIEGRNIILDLGRITAILPPYEQSRNERYFVGQRLKVYITEVEESSRGPKIIASRQSRELIRELFAGEVPEIAAGKVKIETIAREAGERTKIAVSSEDKELDPIGSAVGQRGARVQAVLSELGQEKIDIILFDDDPKVFIANALSPAKTAEIKISKKNKKATVQVEPDQLSLAIGKGGQNVRLAGKLTGWEIDILKEPQKKEVKETSKAETKEIEKKKKEVKETEEIGKIKEKKKRKKITKSS